MSDERLVAAPVSASEFADLMARLSPFERSPALAVAVSGGADSLALALLAHDWARARGGGIVALTVDHGLRAEAAAEAATVGRWLAARGICHRILVRTGGPLRRDVQAAARAARYRLLEDWCETAGILHLLTAHHREDQAETLLLRLGRGSGLDGLAGMAAIVERRQCRLLRPLLSVPRARLRAGLVALGQDWVEDPGNRNTAYARSRLRQGMEVLGGIGLTADRLAATAAQLGGARAAVEAGSAALLASAIEVNPAGFARLDVGPLGSAPVDIALRALAALVATISGSEFPPRLDRLLHLYRALPDGLASGRTLGGCRILPRRGGILVCREAAAMAAAVPITSGVAAWDGRFAARLPAPVPAGLTLGPLGDDAKDLAARGFGAGMPAAVRPCLPAFRDAAGVVAAPFMGYVRDANRLPASPVPDWGATLRFKPTRPLARARFTVV